MWRKQCFQKNYQGKQMLLIYKNFPVSTRIETMGDSMLVLLKKKKQKKEIMNNIFTEKL